MSYTYYTGTEKGSGSYMKYRARLGIDTSDGTSAQAVIKWIGQAQSTQISGYGIKVAVSSSGDTSGYSGSKSGSDTGVVSDTTSFATDASTSGTLKIPRGHSKKEVKITATVSGVTVSGHSGVPWGDSSVSHTITISALDSYTVKYNANGGSGAPSSQTKWYGETLKLSTTKPTRSGYTFVGWGLSSSDTSKNYDPGDSYTKNSGDTLYAIWKKTITLSYNANGGSGAPSSTSSTVYNATTSHKFTISTVKPTRTGYTFKGWSTSSSATSPSYSSGGSITLSSSDTLYAVWAINSYTVTYNYNYSGSTSTQKSFTYNSNITLSTPTRNGYTFLGWYTASSGGTKLTTSYKVTSSITIYAQWKAATVSGTIYTLNSSENKYIAYSQTYNIGTDTVISAQNISNFYTFIGWTAIQPTTFPAAYIYPYTTSGLPSGVVTYPRVETTSSNKIFYAVYKDAKPTEIKVTRTATYRTNSADIDDLIAHVNDETITSEYSDTRALFGYFELNGSVKNISISYSPTVTSGLITLKQLNNRVYFLISAAADAFKITTAYTVSLSSIDSLGKPVTGSCVFKKRSILLDISAITDTTKNVSGVVLNNRVNIKQGYQNGLNILDSNDNQVGDRASLYRDVNDDLILGNDSYRGSVHSTYVNGNNLYLYSNNTIETNNGISVGGRIIMPNDTGFRFLNSSNNPVTVAFMSTGNGVYFGNTGYNTVLYGANGNSSGTILSSSGNLVLNGSVTVNRHASAIGYTDYGEGSTGWDLTTDSNKTVASRTFSIGTWAVVATARFTGGASSGNGGVKALGILTGTSSLGTATPGHMRMQVSANYTVTLVATRILNITVDNTTVTLQATSTQDTPGRVAWYTWRWVRIA